MMHSRARGPFYGDLRFLVGLALVTVSVIGVWLLVSSSRQTTPILQATRTILPGEAIDTGDLQIVEVGLGALSETYLAPQDVQPGSIVTRTLSKGELVPLSAIGDKGDSRTTTVVVSSTALPDDVRAGTVVELWYAPLHKDGRTVDAPRVLVGDAVVAAVAEAERMLSQSRTDVEVVIDRSDVADVLAAIASESTISIVPAGAGS